MSDELVRNNEEPDLARAERSKEDFWMTGNDLPHEVAPDYRRFPQKMTIFSRASWDPQVKPWADRLVQRKRSRIAESRNARSLIDHALIAAAWYLAGSLGSESGMADGGRGLFSPHSRGVPNYSIAVEPWIEALADRRRRFRREMDRETATRLVRRVARVVGADLVGIAAYDERWVYASG